MTGRYVKVGELALSEASNHMGRELSVDENGCELIQNLEKTGALSKTVELKLI